MHLFTAAQTATLKPWFLLDKPGPLVGLHVIHTGNGTCRADRWAAPCALLLETPDNHTLLGKPHTLESAEGWPGGFGRQRFWLGRHSWTGCGRMHLLSGRDLRGDRGCHRAGVLRVGPEPGMRPGAVRRHSGPKASAQSDHLA
jgi:hypothetical protein